MFCPGVMLGVMLVRMSITNEHHSRVGVMAISDNSNDILIYVYIYIYIIMTIIIVIVIILK